jgi:hypothetical protein
MPGPLEFLTQLMPDDAENEADRETRMILAWHRPRAAPARVSTCGEQIAHEADLLAQVLGQDVVTRIARGQLRVVGVSTLSGQLGVAVEHAFGPLESGVIIVAEQQE